LIRNSNKSGTKLKSRRIRTKRARSPEVEILETSSNSSSRLNNLADITKVRSLNQRPGLQISPVLKPISTTLSVSTSNMKDITDGRLLSSKSARLSDSIRSSNNRLFQRNTPKFGKELINSSRITEINIGGSGKSFITGRQQCNSVRFRNDKNVSSSSFYNDTDKAPSHLVRMTGKQNRGLADNSVRTDMVINADGRREARFSCTYCPYGNYIRKEVLKHIGSYHRDRKN